MSDRTYRDGIPFAVDYDRETTPEARPPRRVERRATRDAKKHATRSAPSAAASVESPGIGLAIADDLPASTDVRWVRRRKAQVVAAVRVGILTLSDALARYSLSLEEFIEWEREVGRELQERRRTGRLRELTKSRHGLGRATH